MKTTQPELIEILHAPEHYSHVCGCTIPESYEGTVETGDPRNMLNTVKVPGDSHADIIQVCKRDGNPVV